MKNRYIRDLSIILILILIPNGCSHSSSEERSWIKLMGVADGYFKQGQFDKSAGAYLKAIQYAESTFGTLDKRTIFSQINLARVYHKTGKLAAADSIFTKTIRLLENSTKSDSTLIECYLERGELIEQLSTASDALSNFLKAVEIGQRVLDMNSRLLYVSRLHLAYCYMQMSDWKNAECIFRQIHQTGTLIYGSSHELTLNATDALAASLIAQGKYSEAESTLVDQIMQLRIAGKAEGGPIVEPFRILANCLFLEKVKLTPRGRYF